MLCHEESNLQLSLWFFQAPSKASHLSSRINEEIKRVAAVMGTVCLFGAALTTIWNAQVRMECFRNLGMENQPPHKRRDLVMNAELQTMQCCVGQLQQVNAERVQYNSIHAKSNRIRIVSFFGLVGR